ncbi:MAG: glycosyl transferase group 1 [Bacteroidetes bacterium]|nr:glycosyl transferase group 1 [Bacteroidota bacterium]
MKILHIIPDLSKGGAERLATDIIRELARRKDVVPALVVLADDIQYSIDDIREYTKIIPSSVTLSILKPNAYQIGELQKFVDDFQPDVIHSHLFKAEIVSRSLDYKKAKWFSHCHWNTVELTRPSGFSLSKKAIIDKYVFNFIFKKYIACNNHFIAISKNAYDFYAKNLPELKKNIFHVSNAVNTAIFKNDRSTTDLSGKQIQLISVGSLLQRKNQMFQIQIAKTLKERGLDFHLNIYGKGVMREALAQRIEELGLRDNVTLRGVNGHIEGPLADSHIFLHTAIYEPFGLVIVEAMAAGLPIVALDGGGNRELIKNGENGYLITEADANVFADMIIEAFKPATYPKLSTGAVNTSSKYDIVPYVTKLLDLYSQ